MNKYKYDDEKKECNTQGLMEEICNWHISTQSLSIDQSTHKVN